MLDQLKKLLTCFSQSELAQKAVLFGFRDCPLINSTFGKTVIITDQLHCHPVQGLYRIHPQGGDCRWLAFMPQGNPCQMDCVQSLYTMTAENAAGIVYSTAPQVSQYTGKWIIYFGTIPKCNY